MPVGRRFRPLAKRWSRRGGDLRRQPPQLDEALGQRLVEGVAGVVGREVVVVEGLLPLRRPVTDGAAAVQRQPDLAGDMLAGLVDEAVEGALERREPQAVVDQLGPALLDAALEPGERRARR